MVIETHADTNCKGSNKITYCHETKELNLYLALGFYGTNLKFVDGAEPPPRPPHTPKTHEYDIVTRKYVDRATSDAWTVGRATAHFTDA